MSAAVFSQKTLRTSVIILLIAATFIPRLVLLGTSITIDEPLWLHRGEVFVNRMATFEVARAIPSIQPGVTTSWIAGIASSFHSLAASQASIGLVSGVLILIASYFLITLIGFRWGVLASLIIALDPFLIAHGRVVHTDSLLALSMLCSFLALLVYGENLLSKHEKPFRYLVFSAFFIAFAVLTKIFALALLPIFVIVLFYYHWRADALRQYIPKLIAYGIVFVLTLLVIWPTLIVNFNGVYHQLTDGISNYAEGTRDEEVTSQWWYYAREMFFRITPVTTIFIIPSLLVFPFTNRKNKRVFGFFLFAGLFYAIVLSLRGEKSDRYVLFSLLAIAVFCVNGIRALCGWVVKEWPSFQNVLVLIISGVIVISLVFLNSKVFPYPLAYFNPLYPIENNHKLGWGEGLEQAATWLSKNHPNSPVSSYYPRVFSYFYTGNGEVDSIRHISTTETSYLVLYRSMFERGSETPEYDLLHQYVLADKIPVYSLKINGLPYVWIFEHPPEE